MSKQSWLLRGQVVIVAALCTVVCAPMHAQDASAKPTAAAANQAAEGPLEEIVIVSTGYTKEKKKDIIGAVSAVDLKVLDTRPAGSIIQMLQGAVAGVQIITDGNPASGTTVRIRGQGLGGLGFNDPLFIVDGIPLNTASGMQEINPYDIESVQVLRDAASASIYGARAANGVIVITTKRGTGHMDLSISAAETRQNYSYNIHPLNTQQRAQVWFQRAINSGQNPNNALYAYTCPNNSCGAAGYTSVTIGQYTDAAGNRYLDPGLSQRVSDTNWFSAVTEQSKITDTNVSLSNSTEDSHFFTSVGFFDAKGVVKKSEFKRFSMRLNADHDLFNNKLTIGNNFLITNQIENAVNSQAAFILSQALETQSIIPIRTADGKGYGGPASGTTDHRQAVEILNDTAGQTSRLNKILANVYGELRPFEGLTLRASVGTDYSQKYYRYYTPGGFTGNVLLVDSLNTSYGYNQSITTTDTAEYKRTFRERHNFSALVGYENIDFKTQNFFGSGSGLASPADTFTFLSEATQNVTAGGGGDSWTLKSWFSKLNYDYNGKYLASATIRRDGSSRFGANNRYGAFPSFAVGWRISQEPFFKVDFINDLKLRLGAGTNGNQEISTAAGSTVFQPRYSTTSLFADFPCCHQETGTAYDLNGVNTGTLPSGFAKTATGNPNLKWETSKQLNFGVDWAMFHNKLEGAFDIYRKRTSDILTTTQPLATAGEGAQQVVNGGTIENKGWELEIGHRTEFKLNRLSAPIKFHVSGNISHSSNSVLSLPASVLAANSCNGVSKVGKSINSLCGFAGNGIFQNAAELAALNQPGGYVGGLRIKDVNGDGKIDANDRVFFGSTDTPYTFGVDFNGSYREWGFDMAWQGVRGGRVFNGFKGLTDFTSNPGSNYGGRVLNAWTPTNTGSTIPAVSANYGQQPDTYFFESASYIKLRNLSVTYNLPDTLLARGRMKTFKVYLQGENLAIIKPSDTVMQDPETPGAGFPIPKRYTLGFQGTF